MEINTEDFMVCHDCLMIIANDDATGLDYYLSEEVAAAREREIREAVAEIQREKGPVVVGDSDLDNEFSSSRCDCCGSKLAGSRHHCVIIGSGQER